MTRRDEPREETPSPTPLTQLCFGPLAASAVAATCRLVRERQSR